ncbi:MAG: class I SAM-dependent methyltransferase [Saprospirales bacterium]|nr:MAG: class I SAM-dependent methyltransferase [Saprospirales bacterium]
MRNDWFVDWFNSPYYDLLYKDRSETEARDFLRRLLDYLEPLKGARMLDLACGKGRYSRFLAAQGYDVTGVDISPERIEAASSFEYDRLRFYQHDMRKPFKASCFDYVFNFFTSFGYFDSDREHLQTLENVRKSLVPDGHFLIDYLNSPKVISSLVKEEKREMEGIEFAISRKLEAGFIIKRIKLMHDGKVLEFSERVRAFEFPDFERMFQQTGFQIREVFGDYNLNPYDREDSDRLIILCEIFDN